MHDRPMATTKFAAQMAPPRLSESEASMPSIREYTFQLLGGLSNAVHKCDSIRRLLITESPHPELAQKEQNDTSVSEDLHRACEKIKILNEQLVRIEQVVGMIEG